MEVVSHIRNISRKIRGCDNRAGRCRWCHSGWTAVDDIDAVDVVNIPDFGVVEDELCVWLRMTLDTRLWCMLVSPGCVYSFSIAGRDCT